ncbi:MAG: LacI family transcriptional regulator [Balneolales bacterium]|nr:LacI family transcriptional regulator [Balneolales bacterium]
MKKTTLKDISGYTGLSVSTVSRILRGESNAESRNVKQVIDAALSLNYPLNTGYLNAKYNFKSKLNIALVTTLYPQEFYAALFTGFRDASILEGVSISTFDFNPSSGDIAFCIKELIDLQFDAAILFLPTLQETEYKPLVESTPSSFPLISVFPLLHPQLDTITFDSYGGGYLAAQHFYNQGYKEVGIVNGPFERYEALLRKNGFYDFVSNKPDMELVWSYNGNYTFEDGKSAFENYQTSKMKPEAIFCANDTMCIGFLKEASNSGITIPKDLALIGFDDLTISRFVHPSITSIKTDYKMLGIKALKVIKDQMFNPNNHIGIQSLIPVTLSIRDST